MFHCALYVFENEYSVIAELLLDEAPRCGCDSRPVDRGQRRF